MMGSIVKKLTTRELAHIIQPVFQPFRIELNVEQNGMQMRGHNHIRIDSQEFVLYTEIQTISDDFASICIYKYWKPFNDRECHIIKADSLNNAIILHVGTFPRGDLRSLFVSVGDLRRASLNSDSPVHEI